MIEKIPFVGNKFNKLPNPLNKAEMKAASQSDTARDDVVDRLNGIWPSLNWASLLLFFLATFLCVIVIVLWYFQYTGILFWVVFIALVPMGVLIDKIYYHVYAPEAILYSKARRKNLPIGRIHWGNNMESHEPLYKDSKGSLFFKRFGKKFGLDMSLYNEARSSFCRGIEFVDYLTDALLPFGGLHAAVAFQSADYLRDPSHNFPKLSNMPLMSMMVLINKPIDKLQSDVYKYVHVNVERIDGQSDDDYDDAVNKAKVTEAKALIEESQRAQKELKEMPIIHGVYSWGVLSQIMNSQLDIKWAADMESEIKAECHDGEEAAKRTSNMVTMGILILGAVTLFAVIIIKVVLS
jgi:hypothetical protein